MIKRMLIFGGKGFVGKYLSRTASGFCDVTVVGREVDVRNRNQVADTISKLKPDYVINLAAISSIPESFSDPILCKDINFGGTLNILDGLKRANFCGSFLFVSSSQVYGQVTSDFLPINERHICLPSNPYGHSKLSAEHACVHYSTFSEFKTIIARPFNHVGSGQSSKFVIPSIVEQIKNIQLGNDTALRLGNLDSTRDFLHVSDVARAYIELLENGKNGSAYNVCSGKETSISTVVKELLDIIGIDVEVLQGVYSEGINSVQRVYGDNSKILEQTSWKPALNFRSTLQECLIEN
jgi:GDP-4-dehydro-6-deoxy-D-mannose reductase